MLTLKVTKRNFDKAIKLSKKENCNLNCAVAVATRDNAKLNISGIGFTVLSFVNGIPLHCIKGDMPAFTHQFDNLYPFDDIDRILALRATLPLILEFDTI
jgi:uncharacterized metal-binding protein